MKAIRTRYVPCTDTKGSRLVACDADGNRISIPYPHELNTEDGHRLAAQTLMDKMSWPNKIEGGGFGRDTYWIMLPQENGKY